MNCKKPRFHDKFREKRILAKVCPREHAYPKHRGLSVAAAQRDQQDRAKRSNRKRSTASISSKDSQVSKKSKTLHATAIRMADRRSFLRNMRLDQTLCHLLAPVEAESGWKPVCAMCQWATGNQYRAQVLLIVFPVALDEGWDGGGAGPYLGQLNIIKYY